MIELLRLALGLAPQALAALVDLVRAAARGESEAEILRRAEKFAHVAAFEILIKKARRG